jgi:superfamily II DNA/RNA helicase
MLDMGFIPDVERIVNVLPKLRQTLFFSATMASEIRHLSDKFLMNPKEISVAPPASPAKTVRQRLVRCGSDAKAKRATLRALIDREGDKIKGALIFCNRKRDVDIVKRSLARHGYDAECLHGDMPQPARMETLNRFRASEIRLLVCSDVAARGLDIPAVSHVFNYDVPSNAEDYVHRIGRTGRAGRSGKAYMLLTRDDEKLIASVRKLIGDRIEEESISGTDVPPSPEQEVDAPKSRSRRGHGRRDAEDRPRKAETEAVRAERAEARKASVEKAPVAKAPAAAAEVGEAETAKPQAEPIRTARAQPKKARPEKARAEKAQESHQGNTPFGDHVPAFILREVTLSASA